MKLRELLSALPGAEADRPAGDVEVGRVVHDSREVRPGDLFVAIRGEKSDGLAHVPEALARGAVAIVSERSEAEPAGAPWVRVENARRALDQSESDTIPDAGGLSARQALALFAGLGVPSRLVGSGFVTGQQPPPGAVRRPETVVTLFLSEDVAAVSRSGRGHEETLPANPGP